MQRYVVRPDSEGFTVVDTWTGEVAVIAMARQSRLPREDAEHVASLLNDQPQAPTRPSATARS